MRKIILVLSIVILTACGGSSSSTVNVNTPLVEPPDDNCQTGIIPSGVGRDNPPGVFEANLGCKQQSVVYHNASNGLTSERTYGMNSSATDPFKKPWAICQFGWGIYGGEGIKSCTYRNRGGNLQQISF